MKPLEHVGSLCNLLSHVGRARRHLWAWCVLFFSLITLQSTPAHAGLDGLANWEGDSRQQGFGFVSVGAHLPIGRHLSLPIGVTMSYLYYHYDSTGTNISQKSPGVSLMTGIRVGFARGSVSIMAGRELRWNTKDTSAPGSTPIEANSSGVVVQTYDDLALSRRWQASGLGVYVGAASYLVGRAAIRYQVSNLEWRKPTSFFVGAEGVRQGNNLSDGMQAGGFLEWNLVPQRLSWAVHSGYKENWSPGQVHQHGSYFGLGLYRRF